MPTYTECPPMKSEGMKRENRVSASAASNVGHPVANALSRVDRFGILLLNGVLGPALMFALAGLLLLPRHSPASSARSSKSPYSLRWFTSPWQCAAAQF
jgi:hypothetical protein